MAVDAGAVTAPAAGDRRRGLFNPTLHEIESDPLTALARQHWPPVATPATGGHKPKGRGPPAFDAALVARILKDELRPSAFAFQRLMLLEFSQYLERYARARVPRMFSQARAWP